MQPSVNWAVRFRAVFKSFLFYGSVFPLCPQRIHLNCVILELKKEGPGAGSARVGCGVDRGHPEQEAARRGADAQEEVLAPREVGRRAGAPRVPPGAPRSGCGLRIRAPPPQPTVPSGRSRSGARCGGLWPCPRPQPLPGPGAGTQAGTQAVRGGAAASGSSTELPAGETQIQGSRTAGRFFAPEILAGSSLLPSKNKWPRGNDELLQSAPSQLPSSPCRKRLGAVGRARVIRGGDFAAAADLERGGGKAPQILRQAGCPGTGEGLISLSGDDQGGCLDQVVSELDLEG